MFYKSICWEESNRDVQFEVKRDERNDLKDLQKYCSLKEDGKLGSMEYPTFPDLPELPEYPQYRDKR